MIHDTEKHLGGGTLLVEDDPVARKFITRVLEERGHTCHAVPTGEDAWEEYIRGNYTLIISDWVLPGMSGPELCRKVRMMEKSRYTHILIITSNDSPQEQQVALDAGADDYLTKPLSINVLNLRIAVAENNLKHRIARIVNEDSMKTVLEDLNRLHNTDPLTGVYNRSKIFDEMKIEFSRSIRLQLPMSVAVLDLDHLDDVNTGFGSNEGDRLLRQATSLWESSLREYDRIGRLDGDSFLIMLPETGIGDALLVARRILRESVAQIDPLPDGKQVTFSAGLASRDEETGTVDDLVVNAAALMRQALLNGGNQVAS